MTYNCSLYFAYGSNLSIQQMERRCPAAKPLGKFILTDSLLVFRGVADSIYKQGEVCHGGLWKITPECETALDRYEGILAGSYRKEYVALAPGEYDDSHLMMYVMNSTQVYPPAENYLATIAQGYRDFRLPMDSLKTAVRASWDQRSASSGRSRKFGDRLAPRPRAPGEPAESFPISTPEPPRTGRILHSDGSIEYPNGHIERPRRYGQYNGKKSSRQISLFDEWEEKILDEWQSPII